MAPEQKLRFVIEVDAASSQARIRAVGDEVKGLDAAGRQAEAGLSQARRGVQSISQSLEELKQAAIGLFAFNELKAAGAGFLSAADAMTALNSKLAIASRTTADFVAAQQLVAATALESHQSLEGVGQLYTRIGIATKNTSISQTDLADTVRAVALATSLANTTATEASQGMLQFSQAMGSGRMQGDELRSVMESMPLVASALVEAVGGDMAKFRKMAEEGLITTEFMMENLKKKLPEWAEMQAGMPVTVGKAMTDLRSKTQLYIGEMDAAHGISLQVGEGVAWLGNNLDLLARGGVATLTAGLTILTTRGLASVLAMTPQVAASLTRLATTTQITTVATAEYAAVLTTTSRASAAGLAANLVGLVNPLTAITTVLGLGAAAWMMWGDHAENAADRAKKAAADAARDLRAKLALANPEFEVDAAKQQVEAQSRVVAAREAEWRRIQKTSIQYSRQEPGWLQDERKALANYQAALRDRLKSREETEKQLAIREVAAEVTLSGYIKEQERGREMATADHLRRQLLTIDKNRQDELAVARRKFKDAGELAAAEASVKARYAAEEAAARANAGKPGLKKAGKDADAYLKSRLDYMKDLGNARHAWENKAELAGLTGLDKQLADIGQKADDLRDKYGDQAWIGDGQADRENDAIQADYRERQKKQREETGRAQEKWDKLAIAGLSGQAQELAKVRAEFADYRQELVDSAVVLNKPMAEVYATLDNLALAEARALQQVRDKTGELSEFQIQAFRNMESAAGTFFFDVMQGRFDNFFDGFVTMLQKMVAEWTAAQAMMGLFGKDFSKGGPLGGLLGTASSAIGGWLGGGSVDPLAGVMGESVIPMFGGGRAAGGPVSAGKMYEVNEYGIPELLNAGGKQYLLMGPTGGSVVPAGGNLPAFAPAPASFAPASAPSQISITIIAADAQSITDMMRRNPQAILGPLRDALQKGDRGLRGDLQRVM